MHARRFAVMSSVQNNKTQYGIIVWGATFKTKLSEMNVKINRRGLTSSKLYSSVACGDR